MAQMDGPKVGLGLVMLHNRFRHHQGGGGVMLCSGIIDNQLIGPVMVPAGVKINSAAYCELLSGGHFPWFEDHSLSLRKKIMFMQDNAPSHSAKATQQCLASLGFKDNNLMFKPN